MTDTPASPAITPLKGVSAYRTRDGAIHETRAAAELREAELDVQGQANHLPAEALDITDDEVAGPLADQLNAIFLTQAEPIHAVLARLLKARAAVPRSAGSAAA